MFHVTRCGSDHKWRLNAAITGTPMLGFLDFLSSLFRISGFVNTRWVMRDTDITPVSSYHCQILFFFLPGSSWLSKQRVPGRLRRSQPDIHSPTSPHGPDIWKVLDSRDLCLCVLLQTLLNVGKTKSRSTLCLKWQYLEEPTSYRSLTWRSERKRHTLFTHALTL